MALPFSGTTLKNLPGDSRAYQNGDHEQQRPVELPVPRESMLAGRVFAGKDAKAEAVEPTPEHSR